MDLTGAKRLVPILRIVDPVVAKLPCPGGHADAKGLGEAVQRFLRKPERLEARVADADLQPGRRSIPPVRRGGDMRRQPANEFPSGSRLVDAQEYVSAVVRGRPRPEDRRLNFVQVERRRGRRNRAADGFRDRRHGSSFQGVRAGQGPDLKLALRWIYPILSSSSSTALPTFSTFRVSATVRFGLATYQPSAETWCSAIQSATEGL